MQTFLDEIWGVTHRHIKRSCVGYFDCLLPGAASVEDLVQVFRSEPSAVRLVRGHEKKGPENYRLADGSLDVAAVHRDFADGYTIVLDSVERYARAIALLAHSIEVELNYATQVNAYLTPPGSQGFLPHYDDHDVVILQVRGPKDWRLYDTVMPPHLMQRQEPVAVAGLRPPAELRLEAGDVLYLPRGQVHAARAISQPSIHLTVGIHAPTVYALLARVLDSMSRRDDRLHTQLPPRHLDDADARAGVSVLVRDLVTAFGDPGVLADGLDALADLLVRRGRCPPVGPAIGAVAIDGHTRVVKYQPLYSRVTTHPGGVALHFAQLSITAGPDHEAAMLFVSRSTRPFRVGELPGLRAAQQTELARTLITSGFLRRLPDGEGVQPPA
ncbi:MAG: cupin domain-containing protein [Mycobacterium sp.]|nr:cupin domain-containing protein [Mycobacterium sp.]